MSRFMVFNKISVLICIAALTDCTGGEVRFPWQKIRATTKTPVSTVVPTIIPERVLNVCLGSEPESLYIYAERQSTAMWSVLEAIYDGPFDMTYNSETPVILQKTPSFEDGDLIKNTINVGAGDLVVDANNDLIVMDKDVRILPAGCGDNSCAVVWDGNSEIQMDQVTAIFRLRTNILWSDGSPLTAADSHYSFEIAGDRSTTTAKIDIDHTASYSVEDDTTIKWVGVPGYISADVSAMFWSPLPKHVFGDIPTSQIAETAPAARQPLGWGPYVLREWVTGEYIELVKNTNYYRANEGLPKFDRLRYRFIDPTAGGSLSALVAGQCDLVERSSSPQSDISLIVDAIDSTKASAVWKTGPEILQLVVGLNPAAYDDGYNAAIDRPDYFRAPAMRQALAACIDREGVRKEIFSSKAGLASLTDLLGSRPTGNSDMGFEYDPVSGNQMLEQAGWMDLDNDPETARTAVNVAGIPGGTSLSLTLFNPADAVSIAVALSITDSLAVCGMEVKSETIPFDELYAPGPDGMVFGRAFDLALISWQHSQIPACYLYMTNQIPDRNNYWVGGNLSGYSEGEFDVACSGLLHLLPDETDYELSLQQTASVFARDLPAIPLILLPKVVLTRPDFCAFDFDPSARSDLTNLEVFDYGSQCIP